MPDPLLTLRHPDLAEALCLQAGDACVLELHSPTREAVGDTLRGLRAVAPGDLTWLGEGVGQKGSAALRRRGLAVVPGQPSLPTTKTLEDAVVTWIVLQQPLRWRHLFGRRALPDEREQAQSLLGFLGLAPAAPADTQSLTAIDQCKLALAQALCSRPRLVIFDRFGGDLPPAERHALLPTIGMLTTGGIAVLWLDGPGETPVGLAQPATH